MKLRMIITAACLSCALAAPAFADGTPPVALPSVASLPLADLGHSVSDSMASRVTQIAANRPQAADAATAADIPTTAIPAADPVRVDLVERIVVNLGLYNIMVYAGDITLLENASTAPYTAEQKEHLRSLFDARMLAGRQDMIHKIAAGNVGAYSADQLKIILAISQIRYIQDSVWKGANPAFAPDERTITPNDIATLNAAGDAPYVGAFLRSVSIAPVVPDVTAITSSAYQAFLSGN